MSNIEKHYEFLLNRLNDIEKVKGVYVVQAAQKAKYPFIVIDLSSQHGIDEASDAYYLDVDVWHNNTMNDDKFFETESIADEIDKCLSYLRCSSSDYTYIINQMNRLRVPDPDEKIHRRNLKYYIKVYKHSKEK